MTYLAFVRKERKLLSFAVSFTFFSSFGQTFFISLFVPYYLVTFELTNALFGSIYSVATLTGAFVLPYLGQWIDRISLVRYSLAVAFGLLFASIMMSLSWHISIFFISLITIRLAGQGLCSHTAQATMAKIYGSERGKALSISALGYPIGEAILPIIFSLVLVHFHWRTTWAMIAIFIAIFFIPIVWFLIRNIHRKSEIPYKREINSPKENYRIIFRDKRTYFIIPATLMPAFWVTGLFLYQISAAEELGWSATLIATAFVAFAVARIVFGLISGPIIDRFSASKMFIFYLLPMIIGFLAAYLFSGSWAAFAYLGLVGVTMGFGSTMKSALLAETYGTEMIGTVQSLFTTFMVLSTAASPILVGWMLDAAFTIQSVFLIAIISSLGAVALSIFVYPSLNKLEVD